MSFFVIPALVALVLKVYVLAIAQFSRTTGVFSAMVLVFAAHNLTEVIAYVQFSSGTVSELLFRIYYTATLLMVGCMCVYSIEITRSSLLKRFSRPIFIWMGFVSALVLFTDVIVLGIAPLSYSVTAEKGPFYWLFSSSILLSMLFVVGSLLRSYRNASDHVVKVQCLYGLVALLPVVLLGFVLIPLMVMGIQLNAAGFLPICTTLFLLITLQSESKHKFTDIRRFLPFSRERKTALEVQDVISQFSMDQVSYKDMSDEIEKIALNHKLEQANNSVSRAAELLKMKRTTLYSMLDRHGMRPSQKS